MKALEGLENALVDLYKSAPKLPKGFKDFLVKAAPWLALIGGILGVWAAYSIYHWTTLANGLLDYADTLSRAYGGPGVTTNDWTIALYISVALVLVMAIIDLMAFSPLRTVQKRGWDLLFLGMILNLLYSVVSAFTSYAGMSQLIWGIVGFLIGGYFLFQIRDYYLGKEKVAATSTAAEKPTATEKK